VRALLELQEAEPGTFVWERLSLYFLHRLPHDATRAQADAYRREWAADIEDLEEEYEPTEDEYNGVRLGLRYWVESQRYGSPREGGYLDQPMNWLRSMNVLHTIRERADSQKTFDQAELDAQRRPPGA